jgi:rhodanese-related sulfurtransferase
MKNKLTLSFSVLFLALIFSCSTNSQVAKGFKNINQTEFQNLAKESNTVVIDVRSPSEISEGFIDGAALFIDYNGNDFESEIDKLDKTKSYIIYCRSGGRSARASELIASKGFKKVYNLEGGISNWTGVIKK